MPKILISGASGFIGSHLVKHFASQGWEVTAFIRTLPENVSPPPGVTFKQLELPHFIQPEDFEGAHYFVHCACEKYRPSKKNSSAINVEGTRTLLKIARQKKIQKFVFLSSMSAHPQARSRYGQHKLLLESEFDPSRDVIIRPGLVLGKGGLFASISEMIQKSPFIPLINGGSQLLQTISIHDLCQSIENSLVRPDIVGFLNVAHPQPITLKKMIEKIAKNHQLRTHFLSFPFWFFYLILKIANAIRLPLSLSEENLLGLQYSQIFEVENDLKKIGLSAQSLEEYLARESTV